MRWIKRKIKNAVIGLTFVLAFVACVAAVASVAEPGFEWDMLPVVVVVAAVSLVHIVLVRYANSDSYAEKRTGKCPAHGKGQNTQERKGKTA